MRVSPDGFAFDTVEVILAQAARSAEVTHNHPGGVAGAQAVALAVFMARSGATKTAIRDEISTRFGYDLSRSVDDIRAVYTFDVSCKGSVPEAIVAFLEGKDFEQAVRNAVLTRVCIDPLFPLGFELADQRGGVGVTATTTQQ